MSVWLKGKYFLTAFLKYCACLQLLYIIEYRNHNNAKDQTAPKEEEEEEIFLKCVHD